MTRPIHLGTGTVDRVALAARFLTPKADIGAADAGANVIQTITCCSSAMGEIYYRLTFGSRKCAGGLLCW
jgi:hypothetical protein